MHLKFFFIILNIFLQHTQILVQFNTILFSSCNNFRCRQNFRNIVSISLLYKIEQNKKISKSNKFTKKEKSNPAEKNFKNFFWNFEKIKTKLKKRTTIMNESKDTSQRFLPAVIEAFAKVEVTEVPNETRDYTGVRNCECKYVIQTQKLSTFDVEQFLDAVEKLANFYDHLGSIASKIKPELIANVGKVRKSLRGEGVEAGWTCIFCFFLF